LPCNFFWVHFKDELVSHVSLLQCWRKSDAFSYVKYKWKKTVMWTVTYMRTREKPRTAGWGRLLLWELIIEITMAWK
jgi:hypothetical protein